MIDERLTSKEAKERIKDKADGIKDSANKHSISAQIILEDWFRESRLMAGSIPEEFIREIVDTTNIVSLVEGYLSLKKKGKDHWGICPFCDDGKNPSFSVSEQKQFYYCFKCRATGNVIGFLQSHQGLDFVESVEALAAKAGLEVPYQSNQSPNKERDPLLDCMKAASYIFEKNLNEHDSAEKNSYLLKRR